MFKLFSKTSAPAEAKSSATGPLIAFQTQGRAAWSARDTSSMIRTGFEKNPICFRAVKMIAEAAAAVPFKIAEGSAVQEVHPVMDLLRNPNAAQSVGEFLEAFYGQLLLTGDAYIERIGLSELHVLRSDRMQIIPGPDGWPTAFEYKVGAKAVRFDVEMGTNPILHMRMFHPSDDHYGLSPLQSAGNALDVHMAASKWSKALLDNAARPSGAIVYRGADGMGSLPADQYDRLVSEIESNHQGARNAGRPMLLEGGLDWKPMGFSPSDMEFQKTKDAAAREIALAFGVPPMLLGLPGDNTFANYAEANRAFYRQTVLPLVQKTASALERWLAELDSADLSITADLDAIPALAQEREVLWRRVAQADFLSDEEKRKILGLGPKEGA
ncbi:MAG: phage portal protein [Pseudomonadota bacterium]